MSSDSRSRIETGETVGKWQIVQALTPGVPAVYLARHLDDADKLATIKVIPKNPEAATLVKREVRILRALDHPAVPKVYDFGFSKIDDAVWVATEYFDGATLADALRQDAPDWQSTCRLFYTLARGLREAHAQGIVHQAVRPEKVLVGTEGRVQFTDFESAMEAGDLERASSPRELRSARLRRTRARHAWPQPPHRPVLARGDAPRGPVAPHGVSRDGDHGSQVGAAVPRLQAHRGPAARSRHRPAAVAAKPRPQGHGSRSRAPPARRRRVRRVVGGR